MGIGDRSKREEGESETGRRGKLQNKFEVSTRPASRLPARHAFPPKDLSDKLAGTGSELLPPPPAGRAGVGKESA
ncbi:MAG: hypothetical protein ACUZ8N_10745 [Candidatus Scalindua sp.]